MNADSLRTAAYPGIAVTPLPRGWRSGGHGLPAAPPARQLGPAADPLHAHGGGHHTPEVAADSGAGGSGTEAATGGRAPEAAAGPAEGGRDPGAATGPGEGGRESGAAESGRESGAAAGPGEGGRERDATEGGPAPDTATGRAEGVPSADVTVPPAEPAAEEPAPATADPDATPQAEADRAPQADTDLAPRADTGPHSPAEAGPKPAAETDKTAQPRRAADPREWHGIVLVTGTDTEVGKTITTAAVAAAAQAAGLRVAVLKPGQTGTITGAPTDAEVVSRLAGPDTVKTLAEYPEPLAPLAAAKVAELPALELYEVVDAIRAEADKHDLVLVEGAGGLLVPMGLRPSGEAWTFADLATTLGANVLVVARAGLGTLNHTALTLEALDRRGVPAKVILGAWPAEPELVHWANLSELVPHLVGALPAGAGSMDPGVFRRSAPGWLTPALHGVLDNWRVWAEEAG
ncbi:hypothetical protein GCM10010168_92770 [Actinoplanes ianthinogenes]|uniref:ATP-dependent dethiobiotin synthetase BioD n=1 Tax=Actinoplanes ianthinogenes TaxID=122358 RepID=A0ABN6CCT3_9ACTN|nr:hypothetical protein Aiant_28560 [Actinoplanes ianthinogenes]GGR59317.1 hypothetical protein GCM10010168_92770 [Actinoplanes ianthinogenes]